VIRVLNRAMFLLRNRPLSRWSRRSLVLLDTLGLAIIVVFGVSYFVLDLSEPAHALVGVGGSLLVVGLLLVSSRAHRTDHSDGPA
jgi:hypothetical protein